jgi:hypothetical protein
LGLKKERLFGSGGLLGLSEPTQDETRR